jgi:hypothetical protein
MIIMENIYDNQISLLIKKTDDFLNKHKAISFEFIFKEYDGESKIEPLEHIELTTYINGGMLKKVFSIVMANYLKVLPKTMANNPTMINDFDSTLNNFDNIKEYLAYVRIIK